MMPDYKENLINENTNSFLISQNLIHNRNIRNGNEEIRSSTEERHIKSIKN